MTATAPDLAPRTLERSVGGTEGHSGSRGWDVGRLAAFSAAGHPPRVLRALVEQWPNEDAYRSVWEADRATMAQAQWPDPDCDDLDLADGWVVVAGDSGYPKHLLAAPAAPFLLFGRGDRQVLATPGVGVVGTRAVTLLGQTVAATAATAAIDLGVPVVSGLATGTDAWAHTTAVNAGAVTVAVVATGPDQCHPAEHAHLAERILDSGGAIVSEHPFRTAANSAPRYVPAKYVARLMARNRIIAGLSALTVPAEGSLTSGTMGTVWSALGMGRPVVVAVPRESARSRPGAQIALALSSPNPLTEQRLRSAGAPAGVAKVLAGKAPLANAAASDPAELALCVKFAWQLSPLVVNHPAAATPPGPASATQPSP